MCMNSKLKTKDGNPMDLRLPGIAGRLKEMDARELASFTALASNNEEKSRRQATERYSILFLLLSRFGVRKVFPSVSF